MRATGRFVRLRPLDADDRRWRYEVGTSPAISATWRLGGTTPAPATFERAIADRSTAVEAVVVAKTDDERLGYVQLFGVDWVNGTAHLAMFLVPSQWGRGWPAEAAVLVLDRAFRELGLRRVYVEVATPVLRRLGPSVSRWLTEQAVQHERFRSADAGAAADAEVDVTTLVATPELLEHRLVRRLLSTVEPDPAVVPAVAGAPSA